MKKLFKSFKLRLILIMFVVLSATGIIICHGIISSYQDRAIKQKESDVISKLNALEYFISDEDFMSGSNNEAVTQRASALSDALGGRIIITDSDFKVIYDSFNDYSGKFFAVSHIVKAYKGETAVNVNEDFIEVAIPIKSTNEDTESVITGTIYASASLTGEHVTNRYLNDKGTMYMLIIVLVSLVISIIIAYILSYPFSKISKQIKDFAAFDDGKIEPSSYTETDDIATAFNELKVRLKILDDSRQEFVSNVSHELKTPITSIKVLSDSINEQEDVPNELYREFMQDIVAEIDRENSIITDLLSLVKLDKGVSGLNIEVVNVNEMLELIIKRLTPIAMAGGIELEIVTDVVVDAELDDVKMTLALTNLIENGIKYSNDGGYVRVLLEADHTHFTISIEDTGIGIAKEELDHIFERFYRVDKSHSREIGGTGLGLAIARKTILLHRGSIKVESEPMVGTTFIVKIPLEYAEV